MPDWKPDIRARLSQLSIAPSRQAEIVEELTQHLDDRWRELMARGETPDAAARIARSELNGGRLEALLGTLRQARWHEPPPPGPARAFSFDSVRIDLRHAIRALRATPSFTIGALLVLALGTGATTAIFSVVDAVALRPLPFPDPDRIVAVGVRVEAAVGGGGGPQRPGAGGPQGTPRPLGAIPGAKPPEPDALMNVTSQEYLAWADQQQVFESMAAIVDTGDTVLQRPDAELEIVKGQRVTASFFDVLRARPLPGAAFTSQNELAGSDRVVVVSHRLWLRYFGGDPSAVGRSLVVNDDPYTIVGVMPATFAYPPGSSQPADFWTPLVVSPQARVQSGARAIGRLDASHRTLEAGCVTRPGAGADVPGSPRSSPLQIPRPTRVAASVFARFAITSSAARRGCGCSCSWPRWPSCCSSRARTSRTSGSRVPPCSNAMRPCARRSAPAAVDSSSGS